MEILLGRDHNKITDEITYSNFFDFDLLWQQHQKGDLIPWFEYQYLALEEKAALRSLLLQCHAGDISPAVLAHIVALCICGTRLSELVPLAAADAASMGLPDYNCETADRQIDENILTGIWLERQPSDMEHAFQQRLGQFIGLYNGLRTLGEEHALRQAVFIWAIHAFAHRELNAYPAVLSTLEKYQNKKLFTHAPQALAQEVNPDSSCDTQQAFSALLASDAVTEIIALPSNMSYIIPIYRGSNGPIHIVTKRITAKTSKTYGKVQLEAVDVNGDMMCSWYLDNDESIVINTLGGMLLHKLPDLCINSSLCLYRKQGATQELWFYDLQARQKRRMRELSDFTFFCAGSDRTVAVITSSGRLDVYSDYGVDYSALCSTGARQAVYACFHGTRYLVLYHDGTVKSNVYAVDGNWNDLIGIALTSGELAVGIKRDGTVITNDTDGRINVHGLREIWQLTLLEDKLAAVTRIGQMQGNAQPALSGVRLQQVFLNALGCVGLDRDGNLLSAGRNIPVSCRLREFALPEEGHCYAYAESDAAKRIFTGSVTETLD